MNRYSPHFDGEGDDNTAGNATKYDTGDDAELATDGAPINPTENDTENDCDEYPDEDDG